MMNLYPFDSDPNCSAPRLPFVTVMFDPLSVFENLNYGVTVELAYAVDYISMGR
jgi:hypothetical protein